MTEYLTEQEQIEVLKNWLKQYGTVIVTGIVIAFVLISGWRFWQQRQAKILNHASAVYEEMLTMRAQNNAAATVVQAQKLSTHYPKTIYGDMAVLTLARNAANNKDYAEAEKQLNWALNHSSISAIRQIARLRLARLMIAEKKPEQSLQILDKVEDNSFAGLIAEIKGDAYLNMKNISKARESYQEALNALPNAEAIRPVLQMKFDNLATTITN